MEKKEYSFDFIDLFAGLGGFHSAMSSLGGRCVFASELKDDLRALYTTNHEIEGEIVGDITKYDLTAIPKHDVLCAGFPCQPFSQAGKRQGFDDEAGRGNLFEYICDIIKAQGKNKPKFLLLENVANLMGHDNGRTWTIIEQKLRALEYDVDKKILSPHQFGIAQHRKRIYIVGVREDMGGLKDFNFPEVQESPHCDISKIINVKDKDIQPLRLESLSQLKVWQEFINNCFKYNGAIPRFPIWAMEFGADYPYIDQAPSYLSPSQLIGHKGKLGKIIEGETLHDCIKQLPIYAQTNKTRVFPGWKIRYITQNREFYQANKDWIDEWLKKISEYENSHMKLEWNCGVGTTELKTKIVQFRASGIRVKQATFAPALNLCGSQVPVLPWIKLPTRCVPQYSEEELRRYNLTEEDVKYGRYLSVHEAAILQGMQDIKFGALPKSRIYEALGNAVNVRIVYIIAEKLLKS